MKYYFPILGLAILLAALPQSVAWSAVPVYRAEHKTLAPADDEGKFEFSLGKSHFSIGSTEIPQTSSEKESGAPKAKGPAIWITEDKNQSVVDLSQTFARRYPEKVYTDGLKNTIWVLLEWGTEGPASEFVVLSSSDGGKSWRRLADLKKPPKTFPPSVLTSFYMSRKGVGKAVFRNETPDDNLKTESAQIYVASTSNGGRTWSYPKTAWAGNSATEVIKAEEGSSTASLKSHD